RRDPERVAAPAHAADVAHERDLGDRGRRVADHRGRAEEHVLDRARHGRRRGLDDQHRVGLPDHRPHAAHVQAARARAMTPEIIQNVSEGAYLAAAALFIFSLRWLSRPETARRGVLAGVLGMTAAIVGTLVHPEIVHYEWIAIGVVVGTLIGVPLAGVALTAVPQRTALSHAFGGLAAGLVGTAKYSLWLADGELTAFRMFAIAVEIILGFLTFTGSLMAAGKLQEVIPTRPITYRNQNVMNLALLAIAIGAGLWLVVDPTQWQLFPVIIGLSLLF